MNRFVKKLKDPRKLFFTMAHRGWVNFLSDDFFLTIAYRIKMGKKLNLDNPQTYNEKLQWLKIHDRNPLYTELVDKVLVKDYVANLVGDEYLIPTLGVWKRGEDIDFDSLPDQFVLKVNHNSGGLVICKDKSTLDKNKSIKRLNYALTHNYYNELREWPYKNVKPRILAEQYMEDKKTGELRDYKFFCFGGIPKFLYVATERQNEKTDTKFDFFDTDYNHLDLINGHPMADTPPEKPENFDLMLELAAKLSANIPHVRVDFYEVNGRVYFGELTFTHWSGMVSFEPEEWDYKLGELIDLKSVKTSK